MATSAIVCVDDGSKVKCVYNHFDGYPSNLGNILNDHYNSWTAANKLIDAGKYGFSSIEKTIGECEPYSEDDPTEMKVVNSVAAAKQYGRSMHCDYLYVYTKAQNSWNVLKL